MKLGMMIIGKKIGELAAFLQSTRVSNDGLERVWIEPELSKTIA